MKKFEGMLFCTDLDGTLLNSEHSVSKENIDAIEYFKSEGGLFTFITGRPPIIVKEIYNAVKPNTLIGCFNGGGIYDWSSKKYLWTRCLPKEAMELVAAVDRDLTDIGFQLNTKNGIYFCKDNPSMVRFREMTGIENLTCHYSELAEETIKVVFGHLDGDRISELAEFLGSHPKAQDFDFIRSEQTLYEILPKNVSKGALLTKMAELLGIDPEKTVAVGDYNNDISMIKAAGIGYAMGNAQPEVRAVADRITVSNDEHAIAVIVDDLDKALI